MPATTRKSSFVASTDPDSDPFRRFSISSNFTIPTPSPRHRRRTMWARRSARRRPIILAREIGGSYVEAQLPYTPPPSPRRTIYPRTDTAQKSVVRGRRSEAIRAPSQATFQRSGRALAENVIWSSESARGSSQSSIQNSDGYLSQDLVTHRSLRGVQASSEAMSHRLDRTLSEEQIRKSETFRVSSQQTLHTSEDDLSQDLVRNTQAVGASTEAEFQRLNRTSSRVQIRSSETVRGSSQSTLYRSERSFSRDSTRSSRGTDATQFSPQIASRSNYQSTEVDVTQESPQSRVLKMPRVFPGEDCLAETGGTPTKNQTSDNHKRGNNATTRTFTRSVVDAAQELATSFIKAVDNRTTATFTRPEVAQDTTWNFREAAARRASFPRSKAEETQDLTMKLIKAVSRSNFTRSDVDPEPKKSFRESERAHSFHRATFRERSAPARFPTWSYRRETSNQNVSVRTYREILEETGEAPSPMWSYRREVADKAASLAARRASFRAAGVENRPSPNWSYRRAPQSSRF